MPKFTIEQVKHFKAYEKVRKGGRYNMFDPAAIHSSGLTKADYVFVMKNYSELEVAAKGKFPCSKI